MLSAIIIGGSLAAGGYLSARTQAKAAEKAAKIQQEGAREAHAYGEPLYAQAQQIAAQQAQQSQARLAPYVQQGTQGLTALSAFLGMPSAAPAAAPAPSAAGAPKAPGGGFGGFGTTLTPAPAQTVMLRAPTGDIRPVPASQVDYFLARGAQRV